MEYFDTKDGFIGFNVLGFTAENAKAVIIPFGFEKTVSFAGGTAKGPEKIIEASTSLEYFDSVLKKKGLHEYGIATIKPFPIPDSGEAALKILEEMTTKVLDQEKFPMMLGGEHTVTLGSMRAVAKKFPKVTILHFDAHTDLRDHSNEGLPGGEGKKVAHGTVMRRCLELSPDIRLISLGIRSTSEEEYLFTEKNKDRVKLYWAKDKKNWNIQKIIEDLGDNPVYISFDVDGFDSSLMMATGTPQPGGLFWDETVEILQKVCEKKNIIGADVVELAPQQGLHRCDLVAAKLVYKILNYALIPRY